jgi:sulfite exporter TauE/SafE
VNKTRLPNPAKDSRAATESNSGLVSAWARFWFCPVDPIGLHVVRFFAGIFFLASLLPFAGHYAEMFGVGGWLDVQGYREIARLPDGPPVPLSWSIYYLCGSNPVLLGVVYWSSIAVLVLFTLGIWPRLTSVLTWIALVSATANPAIAYDGDFLLTMPAFYLMVGYVLLGQGARGLSPVTRLLGRSEPWPFRVSRPVESGERTMSAAANFAVRLLQVHFAIVMLASGLHKLQLGDWWEGVAFWYPLYPPFETSEAQFLRHAKDATSYLTMLSLAGYATLAWQLTFPLFAWQPRWRLLLLGGAAVAWLGNAFLYRLPLFGPGIFICCLSYVSPREWHRLVGWLALVPGLSWLEGKRTNVPPAPPELRSKAEAVAS